MLQRGREEPGSEKLDQSFYYTHLQYSCVHLRAAQVSTEDFKTGRLPSACRACERFGHMDIHFTSSDGITSAACWEMQIAQSTVCGFDSHFESL